MSSLMHKLSSELEYHRISSRYTKKRPTKPSKKDEPLPKENNVYSSSSLDDYFYENNNHSGTALPTSASTKKTTISNNRHSTMPFNAAVDDTIYEEADHSPHSPHLTSQHVAPYGYPSPTFAPSVPSKSTKLLSYHHENSSSSSSGSIDHHSFGSSPASTGGSSMTSAGSIPSSAAAPKQQHLPRAIASGPVPSPLRDSPTHEAFGVPPPPQQQQQQQQEINQHNLAFSRMYGLDPPTREVAGAGASRTRARSNSAFASAAPRSFYSASDPAGGSNGGGFGSAASLGGSSAETWSYRPYDTGAHRGDNVLLRGRGSQLDKNSSTGADLVPPPVPVSAPRTLSTSKSMSNMSLGFPDRFSDTNPFRQGSGASASATKLALPPRSRTYGQDGQGFDRGYEQNHNSSASPFARPSGDTFGDHNATATRWSMESSESYHDGFDSYAAAPELQAAAARRPSLWTKVKHSQSQFFASAASTASGLTSSTKSLARRGSAAAVSAATPKNAYKKTMAEEDSAADPRHRRADFYDQDSEPDEYSSPPAPATAASGEKSTWRRPRFMTLGGKSKNAPSANGNGNGSRYADDDRGQDRYDDDDDDDGDSRAYRDEPAEDISYRYQQHFGNTASDKVGKRRGSLLRRS